MTSAGEEAHGCGTQERRPGNAVYEAEYELEVGQYCATARKIHFSAIGKSYDLRVKPWRPC